MGVTTQIGGRPRRGYRAGVRAWCDRHDLSCLPARAPDVVAFHAAERGCGLSVTTVELRSAAIRCLHLISGCAVPTAEAQVSETMAGMHAPPPRPVSCRPGNSPLRPTWPESTNGPFL